MWDGILNGCASVLYELAKLVGDWGLAIIIVTLIIRLLLFPLQRKQLKSSFQMQQVQPRMQEIQTLYAGDQVKIQQEMQKLYQETGFNPLLGVFPCSSRCPSSSSCSRCFVTRSANMQVEIWRSVFITFFRT